MLQLSSEALRNLEDESVRRWIAFHVSSLARYCPDVRILYTETQFETLVTRILMRAEAMGLRQENATIAFGYASLTFGLGFELEPPDDWIDALNEAGAAQQAEVIWAMIERRLENPNHG